MAERAILRQRGAVNAPWSETRYASLDEAIRAYKVLLRNVVDAVRASRTTLYEAELLVTAPHMQRAVWGTSQTHPQFNEVVGFEPIFVHRIGRICLSRGGATLRAVLDRRNHTHAFERARIADACADARPAGEGALCRALWSRWSQGNCGGHGGVHIKDFESADAALDALDAVAPHFDALELQYLELGIRACLYDFDESYSSGCIASLYEPMTLYTRTTFSEAGRDDPDLRRRIALPPPLLLA